MSSKLLLLKNDSDVNKARVEAVSKVLESERFIDYTSYILELIIHKFSSVNVDEKDFFAYQNFTTFIINAAYWLEKMTPNDDESSKSNN